jgi:putative colanic acid biosynthesis acetyltransferase WcaF
MRLDQYNNKSYSGGSFLSKLLWYYLGYPLVRSYLIPFSIVKVWLLRLFGAKIGIGVRIKPGVRVKYPWFLEVGDYVWIGEDAWIDNLAKVTIENHVCISQSVYLCTGNHNWNDVNFALILGEIYIEESSWIAAQSVVAPGVRIKKGAILSLGSVALKSLDSMTIYSGNPAIAIKQRKEVNNNPCIDYTGIKT